MAPKTPGDLLLLWRREKKEKRHPPNPSPSCVPLVASGKAERPIWKERNLKSQKPSILTTSKSLTLNRQKTSIRLYSLIRDFQRFWYSSQSLCPDGVSYDFLWGCAMEDGGDM